MEKLVKYTMKQKTWRSILHGISYDNLAMKMTTYGDNIIIMQTCLKVLNFSNACEVHSVECVSKIRSIVSIIFHAIYGGLCIFSLTISLVMILSIRVLYFIIITKSEVWTICFCLGLGQEKWYALCVFLCSDDKIPLFYFSRDFTVSTSGITEKPKYEGKCLKVLIFWCLHLKSTH